MIYGRLEGVCLGTLQGEPGLKSSAQCARSMHTVQGRPLGLMPLGICMPELVHTASVGGWCTFVSPLYCGCPMEAARCCCAWSADSAESAQAEHRHHPPRHHPASYDPLNEHTGWKQIGRGNL